LHHCPWGGGNEGDTRVRGLLIGRTRIMIARKLESSRLTQAMTKV
jgi:hypothetical protein